MAWQLEPGIWGNLWIQRRVTGCIFKEISYYQEAILAFYIFPRPFLWRSVKSSVSLQPVTWKELTTVSGAPSPLHTVYKACVHYSKGRQLFLSFFFFKELLYLGERFLSW